MKPLVFVAVPPAAARALRDTGVQPPGVAYAATPELRESFGYDPDDDEGADYAAQVFAGLAGALAGWDRCVLAVAVATLPAGRGATDHGEVHLPTLRWTDVRAVFVDEPAARPLMRAYAGAAAGRRLAEVWADETTQDVVAEHDLLWFAPEELDQALDCGTTKGV